MLLVPIHPPLESITHNGQVQAIAGYSDSSCTTYVAAYSRLKSRVCAAIQSRGTIKARCTAEEEHRLAGFELSIAERRFRSGLSSEPEVEQARLNLLDAELALMKAETDERWMRKRLSAMTRQDMEGDYVVLEATPDGRVRTEFMSLVGLLSNGDYLFVRTPVPAIPESAATANRFFLISGSLMIAVGIAFAFVFAGWFTRPILEMKGIMARLDFSSKYTGSSHDEIGALAETDLDMSPSR